MRAARSPTRRRRTSSRTRRSNVPISAPRLVIDNISAGYGRVRALEQVSIVLEPGETVALLGTSGNGKRTLIGCIMGLVRPSAGKIYLEESGLRIDLTGRPAEAIVDLGVALVPEGRRLFPKLTVEENLLLGAYRRAARADRAVR